MLIILLVLVENDFYWYEYEQSLHLYAQLLYYTLILTICSMDQMDMYTKYTNDCVTDFLPLSAT